MLRLLASRLLPAVALLVAAGAARADDAAVFNAAQRAEIVAIVRQALKTDPSILRDAVEALQADEAQAKQVAEKAALAKLQPALLHTEGDPVGGNPDGDVTVVEFSDPRCPYCRRMLPVVADLLKGDAKLRLVYKDIPILGPGSTLAARALLASMRQGGYLKLHEAVMTGTSSITEDSLRDTAGQAGLDWTRLRHDMDDPAIRARLDANLKLAQQLGVDGTPVYVIGDKLFPGAVELADLQGAVAAARLR